MEITLNELQTLFNSSKTCDTQTPDKFIGRYVIVRCKDAGVHAGVLNSNHGRSCELSESRRLWYWKPKNNQSFLSGVASDGLHESSKVGNSVSLLLTENCEIILCSKKAEESIRSIESYEQ